MNPEFETNVTQHMRAPKLRNTLTLLLLQLCIGSNAYAIKLAFTESLPPYYIEAKESGLELEIAKAAFQAVGYNIKSVINVHYKRAIVLLENGEIDSIAANQYNIEYKKHLPTIKDSEVTLYYVDCAITLTAQKHTLKNIESFQGKSIWAFKSARKTLGKAFSQMASKNKLYREDGPQARQAEMLAHQRIDIAISDRNIFTYQVIQSNHKNLSIKDFSFHHFTAPTPRNLKFLNPSLIRQFNKGLNAIRENGVYNDIQKKYKQTYKANCE